jgi:hypothetical protein
MEKNVTYLANYSMVFKLGYFVIMLETWIEHNTSEKLWNFIFVVSEVLISLHSFFILTQFNANLWTYRLSSVSDSLHQMVHNIYYHIQWYLFYITHRRIGFRDQGLKPHCPICCPGKCLFGLGEQPLDRIVVLHQVKKLHSCLQFVEYVNFRCVTGVCKYPN